LRGAGAAARVARVAGLRAGLRAVFFMGNEDTAAFDLPGTGGYRAPSYQRTDAWSPR
jgi:hypothetical protein